MFVSVEGTAPICLLSPPEKPIMRMLDARVGDKEAQEFVRRLKEIEKSMEEEWKLSAPPVLVFYDHVLQPVELYWYNVYNIWIFFLCYCLFGNYTNILKKNKETVKLIAVSSLGDELPVTVQLYDVSVLLYFRV